MRYSVETDYKLFQRNLMQYKWFLTTMFAAIAISIVVVGYLAPKQYTSYSTLILGGETVIAPLMDGAAVSTGDTQDWSKVAREILFSRTTITQLMQNLGFLEGSIETQEDEVLFNQFKANIEVSLVGENRYLKISFSDEDPQYAKEVATNLTNIFIDGIHNYHVEESEDAFEFIDSQVKTYHEKLRVAEERLKDFKIQSLETGASSETAVSKRLDRLQELLDQSKLDLREALIQKNSIDRQLSGEVKSIVSLGRQSQYIKRLTGLQDELSKLRLTYHENYPDIVNLKYQVEDVKRQIVLEKQNQSMDMAGVEDGIKTNKVYQDLKLQLSDVETKVVTMQTRIAETKSNILEERHKGEVVHTSEADFAELSRDYEVNKQLYEDLLKRREAARVSKEIDEQRKGLNVKVYESAFVPLSPSGLRFYHFLVLGLLAGLVLPASLIYMYQLMDSKIKAPELVSSKLKLPVLGSVPDIVNRNDVGSLIAGDRRVSGMVWLTLIVIAAIAALKLMQAD